MIEDQVLADGNHRVLGGVAPLLQTILVDEPGRESAADVQNLCGIGYGRRWDVGRGTRLARRLSRSLSAPKKPPDWGGVELGSLHEKRTDFL